MRQSLGRKKNKTTKENFEQGQGMRTGFRTSSLIVPSGFTDLSASKRDPDLQPFPPKKPATSSRLPRHGRSIAPAAEDGPNTTDQEPAETL